MKVDLIINKAFVLGWQDLTGLGVLTIIAFLFILGQMWASKRILWMQSDAYKLSLAYLGVFLISAVGLVNGGFI